MPDAYVLVRNGGSEPTPDNLIRAHIGTVLEGYYAATQPVPEYA